jgi:hypothetical protein
MKVSEREKLTTGRRTLHRLAVILSLIMGTLYGKDHVARVRKGQMVTQFWSEDLTLRDHTTGESQACMG